ncbi:hypothetical protein F4808DRAFT_181129 [Astrocystis sublimbata]|nr:hypothetical protein F4808DRAFT_181129 [Astrocystis sublimbata]
MSAVSLLIIFLFSRFVAQLPWHTSKSRTRREGPPLKGGKKIHDVSQEMSMSATKTVRGGIHICRFYRQYFQEHCMTLIRILLSRLFTNSAGRGCLWLLKLSGDDQAIRSRRSLRKGSKGSWSYWRCGLICSPQIRGLKTVRP